MTVNAIDGIRVTDWIGRDLERLRKLRGLRREDVAAQLTVPVSASTIRNIEHDEHYNVSLDLLRQIATVLGAELRLTLDVREDEAEAVSAEPGRRMVDNEYFIRYVREHYPECPLTNSQIVIGSLFSRLYYVVALLLSGSLRLPNTRLISFCSWETTAQGSYCVRVAIETSSRV